MNRPQIRFDDGASYETYMGVWSQSVGDTFLQWLAPAPGGRWADVGCGNAAFTEMLVERCAPAEVQGIDPAEAQIEFARTRLPAGAPVAFQVGDARALPWDDARFDAAVMALVIFFVPDPAKAVAEMVRVTRPGGSVSAYAWDVLGGGLPYAAMMDEIKAMGIALPAAPSEERRASRRCARSGKTPGWWMWRHGRSRCSAASKASSATGRSLRPGHGSRARGPDGEDERARLRDGLRRRLPAVDAQGRLACGASANAIKGRLPG